jgi:hypothetical protein
VRDLQAHGATTASRRGSSVGATRLSPTAVSWRRRCRCEGTRNNPARPARLWPETNLSKHNKGTLMVTESVKTREYLPLVAGAWMGRSRAPEDRFGRVEGTGAVGWQGGQCPGICRSAHASPPGGWRERFLHELLLVCNERPSRTIVHARHRRGRSGRRRQRGLRKDG